MSTPQLHDHATESSRSIFQPRHAVRSWVEDYVSEVEGAKRHLQSVGYNVRRVSAERNDWWVSSYAGWFDNELLVSLAKKLGYGA